MLLPGQTLPTMGEKEESSFSFKVIHLDQLRFTEDSPYKGTHNAFALKPHFSFSVLNRIFCRFLIIPAKRGNLLCLLIC